jgi:molybdopterin synthase catalytic subunit
VCLRERETHLAERRLFAERRAQALASCEARIEALRAEVFAAKDGVVSLRMTDREREWRMLARRDPSAGLIREELVARGVESVAFERAERLAREVLEAALARFPERAPLARDLAHAAHVDGVWQAASLSARPDPVRPLRELWRTGYVLSEVDTSGVTLEVPPL